MKWLTRAWTVGGGTAAAAALSSATIGGRAGAAEPPRLVAPPADAIVFTPHPQFRWRRENEVPLTETHRIQVARDEVFEQVVCDDTLPVVSRFVPTRPLVPGRHWWRVRRGAGPWSTATAFELQAPERRFVIRAGSDDAEVARVFYEAAAHCPAGVEFEAGEYRLAVDVPEGKSAVSLRNVHDLIIDGKAARLVVGGTLLAIADSERITIRDLTVVPAVPGHTLVRIARKEAALGGPAVVTMYGPQWVRLDRTDECTFAGVTAAGLPGAFCGGSDNSAKSYLGCRVIRPRPDDSFGGHSAVENGRVGPWVEDCLFECLPDDGPALQSLRMTVLRADGDDAVLLEREWTSRELRAGDRIAILGAADDRGGRGHGVKFNGARALIADSHFENISGNAIVAGFTWQGGISGHGASDVVISGNTIVRCGWTPIEARGVPGIDGDVVIVGNHITETRHAAGVPIRRAGDTDGR